jgi:NitT/TauT family transport system permease protein
MRNSRFLMYVLGILALLLVWFVLSAIYPTVIIPSPLETVRALGEIAYSGALFREVGITLSRILIAFAVSSIVGAGLGILAGLRPTLYPFLKPALDLAQSAPPISWLVLALIWFGTGSVTPIFAAIVVALPAVFANAYQGVRSIDRDLVSMARVYGAGGATLLTDVYLPALTPHLFSALGVASSLAVRIVVMGELLGSDSGIGNALALARIYLETPQVFAWVGVTVGLLALLEGLLLRPLQLRAEAWRRQT